MSDNNSIRDVNDINRKAALLLALRGTLSSLGGSYDDISIEEWEENFNEIEDDWKD